MNQTRLTLSSIWNHFQVQLFPWLEDEVGPLTGKQQQLVEVLEFAQLETHLPYMGRFVGRPIQSRCAIARAFVAKAVYSMATTEILIERLHTDKSLRRLCGWERPCDIPSQSTFSRAFTEFSESQLPSLVHEALIEAHMKEQLVGHLSRDATQIESREKPLKKAKTEKPVSKKRGRPKKGEKQPKEPKRLDKQLAGMGLEAMIADLPTACDVGTKCNSQGYKNSWIGYKLHLDVADGGIPISCILTSASVHDSQVAIPLAQMSHQRVTSCYDVMDAAYDAEPIRQYSESLGHVPLIDENVRTKTRAEEVARERKAQRCAGYRPPEAARYNERSTVERINGRLKDEFGGLMIRVKGHAKVMAHLMFGILALTVSQLMKFQE